MIRKAKINDAQDIHTLINYWAKQGKVLPRPLNYIYENIRDFWVGVKNKRVVACCAFHIVGWDDLGEIKSLVVEKKHQRQGWGEKLVKKCLKEAKTMGVRGVFALTFIPGFFNKLGFKTIDIKELPHKIWADCVNCLHFPGCDETGVIFKIK